MKSRKRQWYVVAKERETCIRVTPDTSGPVVAIVRDAGGTDDVNEVAALMRAAPELLEALEEARRFLDGTFGHANAPHDAGGLALLNAVTAAIAKATGGR